MADYRIDFSIQRRTGSGDDYVEVGFGSSGGCGSVNDAAYTVESMIQNWQWETGPGMPEPRELEGGARG